MRQWLWRAIPFMLFAWSGGVAHAACTVPNTLTNGQPADATQVMANINAIANCATAASGTVTPGSIAVFSGSSAIASGNLTGDVTTSGSTVTTLAPSGVTAGTYGNATIVVDAKGRVTSAVSGGSGGGGFSPFTGPGVLLPPNAAGLTLTNGSGLTGTLTDLASSRGTTLSVISNGSLSLTSAMLIGYTPPPSGTNFTVIGLFGATPYQSGQGFGIVIKDTSGNVRQWGSRNGDVGGSNWYNESSVNTGFSYWGANGNGGIIWYKVARVGTNFEFSISRDGEVWAPIVTESATTFLGPNLASIGFGIYSNQGNPINVTCYSLSAS